MRYRLGLSLDYAGELPVLAYDVVPPALAAGVEGPALLFGVRDVAGVCNKAMKLPEGDFGCAHVVGGANRNFVGG